MNIQILIVPYDTAVRGWRSGAGPEHLLAAGLAEYLQTHGHRITGVQVVEDDPQQAPAEVRTGFELMRRVAVAVRAVRAAGAFPVILSGNCNIAVGVLSGLTPLTRSIFWFDAHGESNTPETTTSGFLDGMGIAIALGWCWSALAASVPGFEPVQERATFLLGARDLDPAEAARLARSAVTTLPPARIEEAATLPARLGSQIGIGYLHLDLDALDPDRVGRANSHPAPNGLTVDQLTNAIAAIRAGLPLGAVTIASYAPEYDHTGSVCRAAFAALAATLADS